MCSGWDVGACNSLGVELDLALALGLDRGVGFAGVGGSRDSSSSDVSSSGVSTVLLSNPVALSSDDSVMARRVRAFKPVFERSCVARSL